MVIHCTTLVHIQSHLSVVRLPGVSQPWAEVLDEKEREGKRRAQELMERLRARAKEKQDS